MTRTQRAGPREALLFAGCTLFAIPSCARAPAPQPPAAPAPSAMAPRDAAKPFLRYRSRRLGLSLPLPDGREWRIDDHSQEALVATHAPSQSRVVIAVFHADELVGHAQCEELARQRDVPLPEGGHLDRSVPKHVLEDEVVPTQGVFDTHIVVAVEPGIGPGPALSGTVVAVGGSMHKCYAFAYTTEIAGASDEAVLAARLAVARTRVLGGLRLTTPVGVPGDYEAPWQREPTR
ncbi:MAG: hypothetical protein ACREJ3_17925 [Polyangiaceae bacterium]